MAIWRAECRIPSWRTADFRESDIYRELEAAAAEDPAAEGHLAAVDLLLDRIDDEDDAGVRRVLWSHVEPILRCVPSVDVLLCLAWEAAQ